MDHPNLDDFRAPPGDRLTPRKSKRPPRHKQGEWFVKGPIPGNWLALVATLPGKALHVGLALWYLAGVNRTATVKLTRGTMELFRIHPDAARRGLAALEQAALVSVERKPGRSPRVTILPAAPEYQRG